MKARAVAGLDPEAPLRDNASRIVAMRLDCDVLLPRAEGVETLVTLLRSRRELLFRRFHDLWRLETSKGTWTALERVL